jgi:hypothetical protein
MNLVMCLNQNNICIINTHGFCLIKFNSKKVKKHAMHGQRLGVGAGMT